MKNICSKVVLISALLLSSIHLYGDQDIRIGVGTSSHSILDLNTSSLVWKGLGSSFNIGYEKTMHSGMYYQYDLSLSRVGFLSSNVNYFSLTSSTNISMFTRFIKPIPISPFCNIFMGGGFSSPILTMRKSNLWSMSTVIEGSVDISGCGGLELYHGPWVASFHLDIPLLSLALVQDYSASGNHVLRFASFHNSFQLFGKAICSYRMNGKSYLGVEVDYWHRSLRVIKTVNTWAYSFNVIYRIEL